MAALCGILPVYVGRLTGSDTFNIVLLATGPVFMVLKLRGWLLPIAGRLTFRSAAAWIVVFALPLLLASTVLFGSALAVQMEDVAAQVSKNGGKEASQESKLRFSLWSEALDRGIGSGLLGLGPGAHLVSTPYKRVPPPNFEAHNTPLDLFTQGGLAAVASFGLLVAGGMRPHLPGQPGGPHRAARRPRDVQHVPPHRPSPDLLVRDRPVPGRRVRAPGPQPVRERDAMCGICRHPARSRG